jgi:hypothetical protein
MGLENTPPNSLKDSMLIPSENKGRSWGTLLNMQHFWGKKGMLELQYGDYDK